MFKQIILLVVAVVEQVHERVVWLQKASTCRRQKRQMR